jgi:putative PIN family toxin of toxin-antitoxin system
MKVMFDTNILISAVFSNQGNPYKAIELAENLRHCICICSEIECEAKEKFELKWPELLSDFEKFFEKAAFVVLPTPVQENSSETSLRDIDDRPIYRAALAAQIDYFVTGDKDFLEFEESEVEITSAAKFLELFG